MGFLQQWDAAGDVIKSLFFSFPFFFFPFVQCSWIVYILLEQLWEGGVCRRYRQCCQRPSTFTSSCVDILQFRREKLKMKKEKKKLMELKKFKIVIFYSCMYRERENCCCSSEIMFVNKFLKYDCCLWFLVTFKSSRWQQKAVNISVTLMRPLFCFSWISELEHVHPSWRKTLHLVRFWI